ncbi:helix-turn-helix transcriptional regulator [Histidinibacterium aquaticum]|uniref:Response regulator transcription factor n=1 Tax=Histidinibacterium aquaticum TaxID=2613962 RepID=A0A5J5GL34_9RHOB|nr:LuxR C-terminal-related transcriptional regulator [Histidinibacterium aquaticum]KAA9008338.1 response regulator transcription factor [Histidinibacterium aquaticum]
MSSRLLITGILVVQAVSAGFFAFKLLTTIFGIGGPISWRLHEIIEIGAVLGLLLGVLTGTLALRAAFARTAKAETRLRAAQSAFLDVVEEQFDSWGLTPAERDVALFAVKGLSTSEIAELRQTSEGTVKAQSAAIYRKAGVQNRSQLLSLFIDHLMERDTSAPAPRKSA